MKCPHCGVDTAPDAAFCHHCGTRLAPAAGGEPTAAAEPASKAERIRETLQSRGDGGRDSETEIWQGAYSPRAMIAAWIGCGALLIAAVVLGIWLQVSGLWTGGLMWAVLLGSVVIVTLYTGLLYVYRRVSIHYRLTSQRFYHQHGILYRITDRIDLFDIEDISCRQNILDRMLGLGTLVVSSRDASHPQLALRGIENAQQVAASIDDVRRKEQMRRGILLENA